MSRVRVLVGASLAAFMLAGREALAYLRLGRLDHLRVRAEEARVTADVKAARSVVQERAAVGLSSSAFSRSWGGQQGGFGAGPVSSRQRRTRGRHGSAPSDRRGIG